MAGRIERAGCVWTAPIRVGRPPAP